MFELISQRYERGATIITSNLPFDEWTATFGAERLTGTLLDRLTHDVHILDPVNMMDPFGSDRMSPAKAGEGFGSFKLACKRPTSAPARQIGAVEQERISAI